ncbi:hypothetical protein [Cystobacter fuscus]|uniref:hypothetical protein n=1 Tax=Cystobacter fuscus TaxID=43 RepID=UPI000BB34164|nr:hypothetical protein [Cystobacter fuscus]
MNCPQEPKATLVCSSYHAAATNMFAALARGDMATAMYYLSALTGASVTQQQAIINGLTHFFDEGNQIAGQCGDVARGGFQVLHRLGEFMGSRPYFLKIISTEKRLILGFELRTGVAKQLADNGVHIAVKFEGRVFDAYTGPGGMDEAEYLRRIHTYTGQEIASKEYASFPSLFRELE